MKRTFNAAKAACFALVATLGLLAGCDKPADPAASANGGKSTATQPNAGEKIKLGFLVKQPEETWFQLEWQFAQEVADKEGFELVKLAVPDGERAMSMIDSLGTQGVQGFVICTPDVKLGPAIVERAKANNLKVISVDDRFMGSDGKPLEAVPHLGISARNIGKVVGESLVEEMKKRNWPANETGLMVLTFDELDTARDRTDGAMEAAKAGGLAEASMHKAPQKTSDVQGAFDAANILLTRKGDVKHWLICGMNDSAVIGAVRALEGRQFKASDIIGIGINGTEVLGEFEQATPTGVHGSVLLLAKRHGAETIEMLYRWVKDGKEPPAITYTDGLLITRDNYKRVRAEQGYKEDIKK